MTHSSAGLLEGHGAESTQLATLAIHAGQRPDPVHGAVMQPIVLSSTFAQPEPGKPLRYDYSRSGNPTREALESCLAALEGGKFGFAFASGCAAATTLLHTLKPGDHVVCGDDVYGGTYRLFTKVLEPLGIQTSFVDLRSADAFRDALRPSTRLVWLETPTNPMLRLADVAAVASLAKSRQLLSVVDNTFASPILQSPLRLGADVVLHSTTKYVNGHSDVVAGALACARQDEFWDKIVAYRRQFGTILGPFEAFLLIRGMRTLDLRVRAACASAQNLAARLQSHPMIAKVLYPGLADHPGHALAARQMQGGFGGMLSALTKGGDRAAIGTAASVTLWKRATSLGGVESLIEHRASIEGADSPCPPNLLRLSVGIEDPDDLYSDLSQALATAGIG